jgi:hypothetical protein
MRVIDLAIAADWEYDRDFVSLVDCSARRLELSTLQVWPSDLPETLKALDAGEIDIRFLFDRAVGASPGFHTLQRAVRARGADVLDPIEKVRWASDKATMHLEFIANGLATPYTIILPSFESRPEPGVSAAGLVPLGTPFYIKPANTTGGSLGVVPGAETLLDVALARRTYPTDKYLLQERILPRDTDGRRFWFRGFYALGLVLCAWWDDRTHAYRELSADEIAGYGLHGLYGVVRKIAAVSGIRFFSTEIARDMRGRDIVIDYVNETCDMRLASIHADGVPDAVAGAIASRIAAFVRDAREARIAGTFVSNGGGKR